MRSIDKKGLSKLEVILLIILLLIFIFYGILYNLQRPEEELNESVSFSKNVTSEEQEVYSIPSTGLIVIKEGVSGENFSREVALQKGWEILVTSSSDVKEIKQQIREIHNKKKFDYLLMIGTNEEIPFAELQEGYETDCQEYGCYKVDPALYADLNEDGILELYIGRLPFSSEEDLRRYYSDLEPKGGEYHLENYKADQAREDPLDENLVKGFAYDKCLQFSMPEIKYYKETAIKELIKHYQTATVLNVRSHGAFEYYVGYDGVFSINALCENCTQIDLCECEKPLYLKNRPILIHGTCNNARVLGIQLIENGASAFIGHYTIGAPFSNSLVQKILNGKTIGEAFKEEYNAGIVLNARILGDSGVEIIKGKEGLNNFKLEDLEKPEDKLGRMLYGDPSLKLKEPLEFSSPVIFEEESTRLVINIPAAKKIDLTTEEAILCYTGPYVDFLSTVNKNYWGEETNFGKSHQLKLTIPVQHIKKVTKVTAEINGKRINIPSVDEDEIYYGEYRINLISWGEGGLLYIMLSDPKLDYDKNTQLIIEYV